MKMAEDYLSQEQMHRMPYRTPEGYFESLDARLVSAALNKGNVQDGGRRGVVRFAPYAALAAVMLVMVAAGEAILRHSASSRIDMEADTFVAYYEMMPTTDADAEFYYTADESELSDEDIIDYLIDECTPAESIQELNQE